MDPIRNPFAPGAGTPPPELAGRAAFLARAELVLQRVRAGKPEKSFIATGLRGVGKTVLLVRLQEMAEELGFRTSLIEAREQTPLPQLLAPQIRRLLLELDRLGSLSEAVKRGLRVFRSFISSLKLKHGDFELVLDVDPEKGFADSGDLETDLPDLLVALGQAAASRQAAIALLIDELQYVSETEMSALIMALHRAAQQLALQYQFDQSQWWPAEVLRAQQLRQFGCEVLQGSHIGAPMPPQDLPDWLRSRAAMEQAA